MNDPLTTVESLYRARAAADQAAVAALLDADIAWHEPGDYDYSGSHHGREAVLSLLQRLSEATSGTFSLRLGATLATREHVAARVAWSAERDGLRVDGTEIAVYRVVDGRVIEAWFHPETADPEGLGQVFALDATTSHAAGHTRPLHRPAHAGDTYIGPGDSYRFLVTGEESGGAYFAMEAHVPPGGGPPPHIHAHEDETFYILEGECDFLLGDRWVTAGVGDFVNVPRGTVHCFSNRSESDAKLILTFCPAGIEHFFEDTLERAADRAQPPPGDNHAEVGARYAAAAPRYGIVFTD